MENIENKVPNGENQDTQNSSFFSENVSSSNGLEPKLRFKDFKENWQTSNLSDYAFFLQGLTYHPEDINHKGTLVLRSSNIQNSLLDFEDSIYVRTEIVPNKIRTQKNDVLMCVRNGSKALVGKTALITSPYCGLAWGAFMTILRPKHNNTLLFFYLNSPHFRKQIYADLDTATVKQITMQTLNSIKINIPSLPEQQKIADFLSLIDQRIEKQRQLVESLKKYKRGALSRVFNDILQTEKLSDISSFISSSRTLSSTLNNNKGIYPVYDATGVAGYIDHYDIDSDYITIVKDGSGVGRLQKCDKKSSFIGTLGALVAKNCTTDFLYAVLQTIDFSKFVTGMAIPHIYYKDYKNTLIPFPCEIKQHSISQFLKKIDEYIENENKKLSNILTYKQGLLQQMFI